MSNKNSFKNKGLRLKFKRPNDWLLLITHGRGFRNTGALYE